jgi:hypothetical protein
MFSCEYSEFNTCKERMCVCQHVLHLSSLVVIVAMWWDCVELRPLTGPLSIPQMTHELIWSIDGTILTGVNRSAASSTTNPTWTALSVYPGLRGEEPATNRSSTTHYRLLLTSAVVVNCTLQYHISIELLSWLLVKIFCLCHIVIVFNLYVIFCF